MAYEEENSVVISVLNDSTCLEVVHFFSWLQSCCLDMKYHPAASVNPEMCMSLYVCAHASACLGVSCEYVCVSLSLQGVTLSNRAASCADHPPTVPRTNVSLSLQHFVRPLCLHY